MFQGRRLKIYFDGGCRPNPGAMEAAVVARGATYFFDDLGSGTSSDAEWLALWLALQVAQSLGEPNFDLVGDSLEVIRQASGSSRCRSISAAAHPYTDGKAAGVAFLALNTDVINFNWQAEVGRIRGGRFDKAAFTETLKSIDHFAPRGRFRPINGADPSSV